MGPRPASAFVPAHNWGNYNFGSGPAITDRLNQEPFPQFLPEEVVPVDDVVMATTRSSEVVPNFGKGLVTYISGDLGRDEIKSDNIAQAIEAVAILPLGQKLYIRVPGEMFSTAGPPGFVDHWKITFEMAAKYKKPVGFRVMMTITDIQGSGSTGFCSEQGSHGEARRGVEGEFQ